jgi:hypothetical protein
MAARLAIGEFAAIRQLALASFIASTLATAAGRASAAGWSTLFEADA